GTPAAATSSFIHALDPSSRAPSAPGPKTRRPDARRRSARPSTSGTSGPTTNRSASTPSGGVATEPGMPGLPGVTTTSASRPSTSASACSRPPLPMTQTFTAAVLADGPDQHLPAGASEQATVLGPHLGGEPGQAVLGDRRAADSQDPRRVVGATM